MYSVRNPLILSPSFQIHFIMIIYDGWFQFLATGAAFFYVAWYVMCATLTEGLEKNTKKEIIEKTVESAPKGAMITLALVSIVRLLFIVLLFGYIVYYYVR